MVDSQQTPDSSMKLVQGQILQLRNLIEIGRALSAEKDHERLLGMIVDSAKTYTNADGCTLYIRLPGTSELQFKVVRNDTLDIQMGGNSTKISWPPVPLYKADGEENHHNVSAHCALTGRAVNIADVYDADFDFQGTKDFDKKTGYRSRSMLVLPMRDHEQEIIGVIQLLNAQDQSTGQVASFPEDEIAVVSSLASQAAIAITNIRLINGLEELLDSIIKMVATAVDEKSPYTAGHVERVALLTQQVSDAVNEQDSGSYERIFFSEKERKELKIAAWMHDIGKMTTPEYVVDKKTKLETIYDRIELIGCKIELMKKDLEIAQLRSTIQGEDNDQSFLEAKKQQLDEIYTIIQEANLGEEYLGDEWLETLMETASFQVDVAGKRQPLLSPDELLNLTIRRGTINNQERAVINNHVRLTEKMLQTLPFPEKIKHVPTLASMHHEKLDGSGYPHGLQECDLPLQARILAVADIFEALTAADRPYKKGKKLSEAMKIIESMVRKNQLDKDVCDLLVVSGIVTQYATQFLPPLQRDSFEWNGQLYNVSSRHN